MAVKPKLSSEAQFKLELMDAIDKDFRLRFKTLTAAAEYADVDRLRLSRIRCRRHEYFSVNWLFRLADAAKVHIRITVVPVNR